MLPGNDYNAFLHLLLNSDGRDPQLLLNHLMIFFSYDTGTVVLKRIRDLQKKILSIATTIYYLAMASYYSATTSNDLATARSYRGEIFFFVCP